MTAPNNLWYRSHVLIFDLRYFRADPWSEKRLNKVLDVHYLGAPYFTLEEAEEIKSMMVDKEHTLLQIMEQTLDDKLNLKKRVDAADYRPCAAHDIAPLLEKAFNIKCKQMDKDKYFTELVEKHGLRLKDGEVFKGLR